MESRKGSTSNLICSNLAWSQKPMSNLLTATTSYWTPTDLAMTAWSFVDPPSQPFSKAPVWESMTKSPHSAWEAPVIMFEIKSIWPGASIILKFLFFVLKKAYAVFMVIPLCLSSSSSSITKANSNLAFPYSSVSFTFLLSWWAETWPSLCRIWPIIVDLPASTWPIITRLISFLISLRSTYTP